MSCDRSLVSVVNALEGYRIRLDGELEPEHRAMFERLINSTLNVAIDYKLPMIPYIRWFSDYQIKRASEECRQDKLGVMRE